ncbi:MAG: ABC transporter permease [Acidimicrobiaceae bacterium]|nr:ABC transporter permease [Acidimicrobiaceae bacterium]
MSVLPGRAASWAEQPQEPGPPAEAGAGEGRRAGIGRLFLETFIQNRLAVLGVGIVVFFLLFCFVGPLIYHTDQISVNLEQVSLRPSASHLLGTDETGYDQLGRLMVAGRTSLEVGFAAAVVGTTWGALWGAVAGYFGKAIDSILMRAVDSLLAIPPIFLLLFLATAFTPSVVMLIFVVSLVSWLLPARLVRGETLSLRTREFVQAARGVGAKDRRILLRHILPNAIGPMIVAATFAVADAILLVAGLSFLGLGIPPPAANWGGMLSEGLTYIARGYWWLIYPPGLCIVLVVVAFNFIGDALRDALEVRLQRR